MADRETIKEDARPLISNDAGPSASATPPESSSSSTKPSQGGSKKPVVTAAMFYNENFDNAITVIWTGLKLFSLALITIAAIYNLFLNPASPGLYGHPPCQKQLTSGHWPLARGADPSMNPRWAVSSCYMAKYNAAMIKSCLKTPSIVESSRILFAGDSNTREIFQTFTARLDPKNFKVPTGDPALKHKDQTHSVGTLTVDFFWDPFLNRSETLDVVKSSSNLAATDNYLMFVVIGGGMWNLRNSKNDPNATMITNFRERTRILFKSLSSQTNHIRGVARLLNPLVENKLDESRAQSLTNVAAVKYNAHLRSLAAESLMAAIKNDQPNTPAWVLNTAAHSMMENSMDRCIDGLHYSKEVLESEVDLILQQVCNPVLYEGVGIPGSLRFDKTTCCVAYRGPDWKVVLSFIILAIVGPLAYLTRTYFPGMAVRPALEPFYPTAKTAWAIVMMGGVLSLCFLVDRTSLWGKTNKVYDMGEFWILNALWIIPGFLTLKKEKDTSFLNRFQTDEWKGWMQFAILIYHYTGASSILPIYSFIRVLVASYLFMTGYGHFIFFVKKKDFGARRACQILVRLNLLSLALAYTMSTDTVFYYFGPLVSFWFIVIYWTMYIGSSVNEVNNPLLVVKVVVSAGLTYALLNNSVVLPLILGTTNKTLKTEWDVKESIFRLALDPWPVHAGMLVALGQLKMTEKPKPASPSSDLEAQAGTAPGNPLSKKYIFDPMMKISGFLNSAVPEAYHIVLPLLPLAFAYIISVTILPPSKSLRNASHPYVSLVPLVLFALFRNSTLPLRSYSSVWFRWIGTFSLETFVLQYHIWLSNDTKSLWTLFHRGYHDDDFIGDGIGRESLSEAFARYIGFLATTVVFLAASQVTAEASGVLVEAIVGKKVAPPPAAAAAAKPAVPKAEAVAKNAAGEDGIPLMEHGASAKAASEAPEAQQVQTASFVWTDSMVVSARLAVVLVVFAVYNYL